MAQRTVTQLIDDIDQEPFDEGEGDSIVFSVDGQTYELDLRRKNADEFHEVLAPYISAARGHSSSARPTAPRQRRSSSSTGNGGGDYSPKAVREWASANGIEVPARGRIPGKVIEQYRSAGN